MELYVLLTYNHFKHFQYLFILSIFSWTKLRIYIIVFLTNIKSYKKRNFKEIITSLYNSYYSEKQQMSITCKPTNTVSSATYSCQKKKKKKSEFAINIQAPSV